MSFYSFVVRAPDVLQVPGQMILLDEGENTFNAVVTDLDSFKQQLEATGVTVIKVCNLEEFEPVSLHETLLLK